MTSTQRFTIEGRDLGYPTSFRDGSSMNAIFLVPITGARELLADSGFAPAQLLPRRAVLSLNCVHYVDTDCGSYEEVALAVLVDDPSADVKASGLGPGIPGIRTWQRLAKGTIGGHSWRLGVSTTLARDCGISMWGYPKVVGDLTFGRAGERAEMTWVQDGDLVLRFRGPATGSRTPPEMSSPVYAIHQGVPQVGRLTQRYRGTGHHLRGGVIELGPHRFADELRRLGLPKRPLVSIWNEHLEFEMSAPRPLSCAAQRRPSERGQRAVFQEGDVLFAEEVLLHLAHGVAGEVGGEQHPLGLLELGQTVGEGVDDRRFVEFRARHRDDHGDHALSEVAMGHADDRRLDDAVDVVDLGLDLLGIHVEPARDDEVLAATDDLEVPVVVDLAEVAGDEEPIGPELLRGLCPAYASTRRTRSGPAPR